MKKVKFLAVVSVALLILTWTGSYSIEAYASKQVAGIRNNSLSGIWYQYNDGRIAYDVWVEDENGRYHINDAGFADANGWSFIDNTWYLFDEKGRLTTGWLQLHNGDWMYSLSDGTKPLGWLEIGNKWYYFNSDGAMQTGWLNVEGNYYFLSGKGEMLKSKWVMDVATRKKYYLLEDGTVALGKTEINGKTWNLDTNTGELLD